jgi:hypothetical protein
MAKKPIKGAVKESRAVMRDDKGRWLPGGAGGPGRKPVATEREYYEATMSACSPVEWSNVVRKAFEETQDNDYRIRRAARDFLLKALFGSSPAVLVQYAQVLQVETKESIKEDKPGITDNTARWIKRKILGLDKECATCESRLCDTGKGCDVGSVH